tara:strand:+ start:4502 stop:5191 length:690 start_codon:yes stop_codon:yes gene_type:complete
MPNWCYNNMTIHANDEEASKELEEFKNISIVNEVQDDGSLTGEKFTFKGVLPMPNSLNITSGSNIDNARAYLNAKDGDLRGIMNFIKLKWTHNGEANSLYPKTKPTKEKINIAMKYLKDNLEVNDLTEARCAIDNIKTHGSKDWYDWSITHWGTKWDAVTNDIDFDDDWITIDFDTAWSPPEPWILALSKKFPNLEIEVKVTEESNSYMGYLCARNGQINAEYAYPNMP